MCEMGGLILKFLFDVISGINSIILNDASDAREGVSLHLQWLHQSGSGQFHAVTE